jgi:hypothetical protein
MYFLWETLTPQGGGQDGELGGRMGYRWIRLDEYYTLDTSFELLRQG